jgi:pimeloyl-ACP methyl ester carboxylesterase
MPNIEIGKFFERIPYAKVGTGHNPILVVNGGQGFMMTPNFARVSKDARRLRRLLPHNRSFILLSYDPDPTIVSIDSLAQDLSRIIDGHLAGRADVVGISYGGVVASRLAIRVPRNIERLVLLAAAPSLSVEGRRRIKRQIDLVVDGNLITLLREFTSLFRSPWLNFAASFRISVSGARIVKRLGRPEVIRQYLEAMLETEASSVNSLSPETHTLLIYGSRDQFFAEPTVKAGIRIPHVQTSIFDSETHMVPVERAKDVKQALSRFLCSP